MSLSKNENVQDISYIGKTKDRALVLHMVFSKEEIGTNDIFDNVRNLIMKNMSELKEFIEASYYGKREFKDNIKIKKLKKETEDLDKAIHLNTEELKKVLNKLEKKNV